jgi:hypothetical protein
MGHGLVRARKEKTYRTLAQCLAPVMHSLCLDRLRPKEPEPLPPELSLREVLVPELTSSDLTSRERCAEHDWKIRSARHLVELH